MALRVIWSLDAVDDLENIFFIIKKKTKSQELARNVVKDIYQTATDIIFPDQYQVDEVLGLPYRRMVVRHYKIVYQPAENNTIRILQIFDAYQSVHKLRRKT